VLVLAAAWLTYDRRTERSVDLPELLASDSTEDSSGVTHDLLVVEDLTVRFGGITAVGQASVRVKSGESCALIGPNGAGKTTLFDAIAGQNKPSSGAIYYLGSDITKRSALWRSQHGIRRTFQRQQTFPGLSVEDNVLVTLEAADQRPLADIIASPRRRRREVERRSEAGLILERVGLYGARRDPAYRLPLGQSRLLELARALAGRPRLLLLDEPTSGMEERDVNELSRILQQLTTEHRVGILLVEHDVKFAMSFAERVYVMHLGQVIAEGMPVDVQTNPRVMDVYLGAISK
jgi:branched-chain amino acid transport system ATP-binding protein